MTYFYRAGGGMVPLRVTAFLQKINKNCTVMVLSAFDNIHVLLRCASRKRELEQNAKDS